MRAGSEPTSCSVSAKAEMAPLAQRGRYSFFSSGEPKSLSGCGTPIDWWAESRADRLPSMPPSISMILPYSTWSKPRPPYSFGIFMPKAPSLRRPSITGSGYSPVTSICSESTCSVRNSFMAL